MKRENIEIILSIIGISFMIFFIIFFSIAVNKIHLIAEDNRNSIAFMCIRHNLCETKINKKGSWKEFSEKVKLDQVRIQIELEEKNK